MKFLFHPEAESEFDQAIEYYEEKEAGLGYDFAVEVYITIERTLTYPKAWPIIEGEIRRSMVRRFPYGILYAEEDKEIFIVAVMHLHRDPEYWKHRIKVEQGAEQRRQPHAFAKVFSVSNSTSFFSLIPVEWALVTSAFATQKRILPLKELRYRSGLS